ncbi:uncharacterized protein SCHCODRAFT_02631586 [Schizophyllum commune H4-8]|uniref:uncharacterized protein n=1 Tax=Schizophyllum commune (strain H4-8 / FGSC 9210) TaxID=578458 RepID=UPI00215ECF7F|nr:uncharacterized protein SCHCODRAFT_02631586 [Schizophyllum commune H4-8]KAI5890347.1 hypothetical protein SCHCODRAFT_02631586 [Schizophyllum commune H4-8]
MREVRDTKGYLMLNDTTHLEAKQKALACFVDKGTWTQDDDSNRLTYQPDNSCLQKANSASLQASVTDLCSTISSKKVLLVGSEATHHLHTLWLDALDEGHTCLGPEFCTFHHVCLPPAMRTAASLGEPRFKRLPRDQDLAELGSALVRFSLSSSLLVPDSPRVYSEVRVDARTGVRARDSNWLEQARRSQVVVMNRGPLPAPAATYNVSDGPDALERWQVPWRGVLEQIATDDYVGSDGRLSRIDRLVNAALDVTLRSMLPEVIETLALMREDDVVSKNSLIWHGAWYKQPRCASGKPSSSNILSEVLSPSLDPWTLYHNLQVYMQNRIMRTLMPSFGVAFMSLVLPRTEGDISHAAPALKRLSPGKDVSLPNLTALDRAKSVASLEERRKRSDCIRHSGTSPGGRVLQVVFLRSLDFLLASGSQQYLYKVGIQ